MGSGSASLYVLVALANGPAHGLGIAENVSGFTSGSVLLGPGTLYRVLKDLTRDGLIERVESPDSENAHRKYYRLTAPGRAHLASALEELRAVVATGKRRLGDPLPSEG